MGGRGSVCALRGGVPGAAACQARLRAVTAAARASARAAAAPVARARGACCRLGKGAGR